VQIKRKGMNVLIPKGYWTTTIIRSLNNGSNGNKTAKKRKHKVV